MQRAREAVLARGGAARANVFTRIALAIFAQLPFEWIEARLDELAGLLKRRTGESAMVLRRLLGQIRMEPTKGDIGRPYYVAQTSIDALTVLEPSNAKNRRDGGSNSSRWWSRSGSNRRPPECHTGEGGLESAMANGRLMEIEGAGRDRSPFSSKTSTWRSRVMGAVLRRRPNPNGYPTGGHFCGIGLANSCIQSSGRGFVEDKVRTRGSSIRWSPGEALRLFGVRGRRIPPKVLTSRE